MKRQKLSHAPTRESVVLGAFSEMFNFVGLKLGVACLWPLLGFTLFALYCNFTRWYWVLRGGTHGLFFHMTPVWDLNEVPVFYYALRITSLLFAGYLLLCVVPPLSKLRDKLPLVVNVAKRSFVWGYSAYLAFFLVLDLWDLYWVGGPPLSEILLGLPYVPTVDYEIFLFIALIWFLFTVHSHAELSHASFEPAVRIDIS